MHALALYPICVLLASFLGKLGMQRCIIRSDQIALAIIQAFSSAALAALAYLSFFIIAPIGPYLRTAKQTLSVRPPPPRSGAW